MKMNESTVIYNNILIAKFMGYIPTSQEFKMEWAGVDSLERLKIISREDIPILKKPESSYEVLFEDTMEYESDWSKLMPVVEKLVNECDYEFRMLFNEASFYKHTTEAYFCTDTVSKITIKHVWELIVQVITHILYEEARNNKQ